MKQDKYIRDDFDTPFFKLRGKRPNNVWELLKAYVEDIEETNNVKFSDEAWQRIKQLEQDIYIVMRED